MKLTIGVIGSNGQLGTELVRAAEEWGHRVIGWTHDEMELLPYGERTPNLFYEDDGRLPDVIINTAAIHDAKKCIDDPVGAWDVNVNGAVAVAEACRDYNPDTLCVYISTDYVFGGEGEYDWDTGLYSPREGDVYAMTKVAGELATRAIAPKWMIVRIATLFGEAGCRGKAETNFIDMIVRKARAGEKTEPTETQLAAEPAESLNRQWRAETGESVSGGSSVKLEPPRGGGLMEMTSNTRTSITCARAAAKRIILCATQKDPPRVLHPVCEGAPSHYTIAYFVVAQLGLDPDALITPVRADNPRTATLHPAPDMLHWTVAITDYLVRKGCIE